MTSASLYVLKHGPSFLRPNERVSEDSEMEILSSVHVL